MNQLNSRIFSKDRTMKYKILLLCGLFALTGCATNEYALYAETQQKIAHANAMAETARYAALAEIAKQGDSAAKVAAVMSLQMGQSSGPRIQQINPPVSFTDRAIQWTSILLPSVTQLYGINANRQIATTQSNNQAAVATSTNNTFAAMSNNMATSNTAIANTGLSTANSIATTGLTATTNVANTGISALVTSGSNGLNAATTINNSSNTAITNVNSSLNATIQNLTSQIPNLQPNITTTNNSLTCPVGTTLVNGSCQ